MIGAPEEIRTPDPQIRSLYQVFEFARSCWKFAPAWHARACQRNLSLYGAALEDRCHATPKPSLPSAFGSRLDPDEEGEQ
jgi:hypothetical protein